MENDLKGIENYFELTGVRVIEGLSYRESTVYSLNIKFFCFFFMNY